MLRRDVAEQLDLLPRVLIDGQRLAQYMYDYNLGVQPEQTIEIKKMDNDFWDSMQDAQDGGNG